MYLILTIKEIMAQTGSLNPYSNGTMYLMLSIVLIQTVKK